MNMIQRRSWLQDFLDVFKTKPRGIVYDHEFDSHIQSYNYVNASRELGEKVGQNLRYIALAGGAILVVTLIYKTVRK